MFRWVITRWTASPARKVLDMAPSTRQPSNRQARWPRARQAAPAADAAATDLRRPAPLVLRVGSAGAPRERRLLTAAGTVDQAQPGAGLYRPPTRSTPATTAAYYDAPCSPPPDDEETRKPRRCSP